MVVAIADHDWLYLITTLGRRSGHSNWMPQTDLLPYENPD
jgi:hypothetical protein